MTNVHNQEQSQLKESLRGWHRENDLLKEGGILLATGKQNAEDCFPRVETVLLLKCDDMKSNLREAIDDQVLPRVVEEDVRARFFKCIRQKQSNGLLATDGLDEVPTRKLPVFTEIIQGRRVAGLLRHDAKLE